MLRNRWSWIAGALLLAGALGGAPACVLRVTAPALVVDAEPPPPRAEAAPVQRMGYVWVAGHWEWVGTTWQWRTGYWQAERTNYAWRDGYWERRGNRWHWVEGHWEVGAAVDVRDHRQGAPSPGAVNVPSTPAAVNVPSTPATPVDNHHEHAHAHPHDVGDHHHHPHAHPHRPGANHHHPF